MRSASLASASGRPAIRTEVLRRRAERRLRLPATLHDYQWDGVAFLYRSRSALLADEMGLGKTVQASVALALLLSGQDDIGRALIVAPASLTTNWISELAIWSPSLTVRRVEGNVGNRQALYRLPIPVLVSSYEQIRQDGLDRIPSNTFDIVILDEVQRAKNKHSATALACRMLPRKRTWALSATPLENDVSDVTAILGFLDPSVRTDLSGPPLVAALESMMLRRRKRDVRAELPPVIIQDLRLELMPSQRLRYDNLWVSRWKEVKAKSGEDAGMILLNLITRLKMICNFDAATSASSKLHALYQICEGAGKGARILVFSQFVETLKWVSEKLVLAHGFVTGSMSDDERRAAMHRFRAGSTPRVLLISLRAGGVGLNLGEASHVVVFDRWWNPAVEMQAIYRAHRFDRDEPLQVIRFLVTESIEERIADILDQKNRMFDEVVEAPETVVKQFSVKEMIKILELTTHDVYSVPSNPCGE